MEKYKVGKHVDWDPDLEIKIWEDREAVLTEGDEAKEIVEGKSAPMVESPKLVEREVGADENLEDAGPKDLVDAAKSLEDIAKD